MPTYDLTEIEFSELDVLETQVLAIVAAIEAAQAVVEGTTNAVIVCTRDPDDTTTAAASDLIFTEVKASQISGPIQVAFTALRDALNVIVDDEYGATPIT